MEYHKLITVHGELESITPDRNPTFKVVTDHYPSPFTGRPHLPTAPLRTADFRGYPDPLD
jgi:hypothetical protein